MDFLEELEHREAIKRLKYRYMRCIDQKLWDEMRTCFTDDATTAYSGGKYAQSGIEEIMKFMTESMDRGSFLSSHRVHHPEIDFTSDTTATGVWALEDTVVDTQYDFILSGAAFYEDRYVQQDGAWKIQHTGYQRTFEQIQGRKDGKFHLWQRAFED